MRSLSRLIEFVRPLKSSFYLTVCGTEAGGKRGSSIRLSYRSHRRLEADKSNITIRIVIFLRRSENVSPNRNLWTAYCH